MDNAKNLETVLATMLIATRDENPYTRATVTALLEALVCGHIWTLHELTKDTNLHVADAAITALTNIRKQLDESEATDVSK